MRISHNTTALNTHRKLTYNTASASKSIEKLSSGLRINRSGDDAAGLSISEKMRGQIRGLTQASRNAQDGISMVQTAEAGASSIHAMLQRGRGLAVQASNDTLTDPDRQALNDEVTELKKEITNTGNNTTFNTINLLNKGSVSSANAALVDGIKTRLADWLDDSLNTINTYLGVTSGYGSPKDMQVEFFEASGGAAASMGTNDWGNSLVLRINLTAVNSAMDSSDTNGWGQIDALIAHEVVHALQFTKMSETLNGGIPLWFTEGLATSIQGGAPFLNTLGSRSDAAVGGVWTGSQGDYGSAYAAVMTLHEITTGGIQAIVDRLEAGDTLDQAISNTTQASTVDLPGVIDFNDASSIVTWFNSNANVDTYLDTSSDFTGPVGSIDSTQGDVRALFTVNNVVTNNNGTIENPNQFNLIIQDPTGAGSSITFHIGANSDQSIAMRTFDLTSAGIGITSVDLSTRDGASQALEKFDTAIQQVSSARSHFGAIQNRLEHTISNLDNATENLTAAESRVRDVDMAKEMMEQTRSSILAQASQAMLAQANQQPQGVLQLLR
jgi:flagellin